jgi:hypothetical protein
MRTQMPPRVFHAAIKTGLSAAIAACFLAGCATGNPASPPEPDGGLSVGMSSTTDAGTRADATEPPDGDPGDAGASATVIFEYTPQWAGVTRVDVVGGFGTSTDWSTTEALVTLKKSGSVYSGTAALSPGNYAYLLRITGDAQATTPTTYERYAVDPQQVAIVACPPASPTYNKAFVQPCSQVTVTAAGATKAAAVHVKGRVVKDGAAAPNWMVWIERQEPKFRSYFVNRTTVGSDGAFDLVASAGTYRLLVQYPTLLSDNDLSRDPNALAALRQSTSAPFELDAGEVVVPTPDVAFHEYGLFSPAGDGGSLPTRFTFEKGEAVFEVYGGPGDGGVITAGGPWFAATSTDGGATFEGEFTATGIPQDAAVPGTRYLWGTEQPFGADAGLSWTNQSMVLPIIWN